MTIENQMMENLNVIFPDTEFDIIHKDKQFLIQSKKSNNGNNECLTLTVTPNSLYIENIDKCGISGSQSLQKINTLAKQLDFVKEIGLYDASFLTVFGYNIDLAILKILVNGESWYNSYGYISDEFENEKKNNLQKIHLPCYTFLKEVYRLNIGFIVKNLTATFEQIMRNRNRSFQKMANKSIDEKKVILEYNKNFDDNYPNEETYIQKNSEAYVEKYNIHLQDFENVFQINKTDTVQDVYRSIMLNLHKEEEKCRLLHESIQYIQSSLILQYKCSLKKQKSFYQGGNLKHMILNKKKMSKIMFQKTKKKK